MGRRAGGEGGVGEGRRVGGEGGGMWSIDERFRCTYCTSGKLQGYICPSSDDGGGGVETV